MSSSRILDRSDALMTGELRSTAVPVWNVAAGPDAAGAIFAGKPKKGR